MRNESTNLPERLNVLCVREVLRSSSDGGDRSCFFFRELVSCLGDRGIVSERGKFVSMLNDDDEKKTFLLQ